MGKDNYLSTKTDVRSQFIICQMLLKLSFGGSTEWNSEKDFELEENRSKESNVLETEICPDPFRPCFYFHLVPCGHDHKVKGVELAEKISCTNQISKCKWREITDSV